MSFLDPKEHLNDFPEEINGVSPLDLLNEGYIQEANRQFFHPLGLALSVDTESGKFGVVWDYRHDEEGIFFEGPLPDVEKAKRIEALWEARRPRRQQLLGYMVQPVKTDG